MHLQRISLVSRILSLAGATVALTFLSGCATLKLTNLTPYNLPENPSQIYTFTLRVHPNSSTIDSASVLPHIVIDGQNFPMKPSPLGEGIYEFDYQLPAGRDEMAYYYLVDFAVVGNGITTPNQAYTGVTRAKVQHRYVLSLESNRGPVGARVAVLGRGFTPQDVISFDGTAVRTAYESSTSLSFFVPALAPGRNYQVTLASAAGTSPIGTFRVDGTGVVVTPSELHLTPGQQQSVSFIVTNPAPAGGLLLDVATDVPESVIMPEVVIPEGQTSVTVSVQGGKPGTGSLVLKGYGSGGQVTVPVTVAR
jgi:hypothetical protein